MARKATPKAKGRTSRQQTTPVATDIPRGAPRRGGKKVRDAEPAGLLLADMPVLGADESTSAVAPPEVTATATADGGVDAAPARRGRRPKAGRPSETPAEPEEADGAAPSDAATLLPDDAGQSNPPAKTRRGRRPRTETAAPFPQPLADQPGDAVAPDRSEDGPVETPSPASSEPSAARWDPATGTASFDWPTIEQVAATDGPNQAMARLLLAARAEGANSRWPF